MSDNGWVKLHRKILDSELWSLNPATRIVAIYLLLTANHEDGWYRGFTVKRGTCVRSHGQIATDCRIGLTAARHAIDMLAKIQFCQKSAQFGRRQVQAYLILNYDTYQRRETPKGAGSAQEQAKEEAKEQAQEQAQEQATYKNGRMDECKNERIVPRKKRGKETYRPDPHADAFKAAFDTQFPLAAYAWKGGDFSALAAWRKEYPDVTPERFVEVVKQQWAKGYCLSIRDLCNNWSTAVAKSQVEASKMPQADAVAAARIPLTYKGAPRPLEPAPSNP